MQDIKLAIVTSDHRSNVKFSLNGEKDDCTSFLSWLSIWDGTLFSYEAIKNDWQVLFDYDCVMFSGNPNNLEDITKIATCLKGRVVTMFLPEGDVQLYDQNGINSFDMRIYQAFRSVDIIFAMEEDKISYYQNLTDSLVKFIHVPIDERMSAGEFRVPIDVKGDYVVVYGDNNPNCPITVFGMLKKLVRPAITVCISPEKVVSLSTLFNVSITSCKQKLSHYSFLRLLARSWVHFYPTRWIGSAREPIACAVAGTPCIGSDRSHTQRRLFPELACDIYDVEKMEKLARKLYEDKGYYKEIVKYAVDQLHFYGMQETKERFYNAYTEVKEKMRAIQC